jgi:hypothetical protein
MNSGGTQKAGDKLLRHALETKEAFPDVARFLNEGV